MRLTPDAENMASVETTTTESMRSWRCGARPATRSNIGAGSHATTIRTSGMIIQGEDCSHAFLTAVTST